MRVRFTNPFQRRYRKISDPIKRKFEKQLTSLLRDLRHPSLRAKKYDEGKDVWQARVDDSYRFYFKIEDDTYAILTITKHRD